MLRADPPTHLAAAYVLSMVFKIYRPKPPRAGMPVRERPCLEHMQQNTDNLQQIQHQNPS